MKFSVKQKLLAMSLIPLISSLFYVGIIISGLWGQNDSITKLNNVIELTQKGGNLVHEIQKERGLTAGFLSSQVLAIPTNLKNQRENVNKKYLEFKTHAKQVSSEISEYKIDSFITEIKSKLELLYQIRNGIDEKTIGTSETINKFTLMNKSILLFVSEISKHSETSKTTQQIISYYNFLQGKERSGVERAVINSVLSKKELNIKDLKKIVKLDSEQNVYFDNFRMTAKESSLLKYKEKLNNISFNQVKTMKNDVLNEKLEIQPSKWFDIATKRINLLKEQEDFLGNQLILDAEKVKESGLFILIIWIVISLLITIITIFIVTKSLNQIKDQTRNLLKTMNDVSKNNNLTARADIISKDELGL